MTEYFHFMATGFLTSVVLAVAFGYSDIKHDRETSPIFSVLAMFCIVFLGCILAGGIYQLLGTLISWNERKAGT